MPSLFLLVTFLLMQPRIQLAFWAESTPLAAAKLHPFFSSPLFPEVNCWFSLNSVNTDISGGVWAALHEVG